MYADRAIAKIAENAKKSKLKAASTQYLVVGIWP
jgi:hypothetical protein